MPLEATWVKTEKKYPIFVGFDLFKDAALFAPFVVNRQVLIISSADIAKHYLARLESTCLQAGAKVCHALLIPSDEVHKTLDTVSHVWSTLISQGMHRDGIIVALGGGMIGDVAGFSAACYMRGISFIQCPTTLLAQIDAAIGGKTGVNHPAGKNLIGAFHQPLAVISDLNSLLTLGQRDYICGLAELIKYGIALDEDFFNWIEENTQGLLEREPSVLQYAVTKASTIKADVVSQDEKETNARRILNFGHTLAHALESLLDYKQLQHGEAVAIGMVAATALSVQNNSINSSLLERLILLLDKVELPSKIPSGITVVAILDKMKHDKKHINQELQWVLLNGIGKATISDCVTEQVSQVLTLCGAV